MSRVSTSIAAIVTSLGFMFAPDIFHTEIALAEPCSVQPAANAQANILASAAAWSNLRNQAGSIRFESGRLVASALSKLPQDNSSSASCKLDCASPKPAVMFTSVPNRFLKEYSDRDRCEQHLKKTKANPLQYTARKFRSLEEFNAWYGDFSQGKGKDGADLYKNCDGSCSPQYSTLIKPQGSVLEVDAQVVCGPARDKDDNQYKLSYSYIWTCS